MMRKGGTPRRAGLVVVGVLVLQTGCATARRAAPEAALEASTTSPSGLFRIEYESGEARDAARIQQAAEAALPRLARWGTLREPVTLEVLPDHEALEDAIQHHGLGWLRAWGIYDVMFVQAPATWGVAGATQPQLNELVLHELTHCLMYQLSADKLGWSRKEIPVWFREGMASFTAEQSYRWVTLEELARHFERQPGSDPLLKPEELYRDKSNLVYGAAHYAFTFLVRRYGEESVRGILREMKGGRTFPEAFESVIGLSPDAFARDFTRYVRWRGFRGGRKLQRASGSRD